MQHLQLHTALASGLQRALPVSRAIPGATSFQWRRSARLSARPCVGCRVIRANESAQETRNRVMEESAVVESRVEWVDNVSSLKQQLRLAGSKLVVLEIQSETVCEAGFDAEPEFQWKLDQQAAERRSMEACSRIKHTFSRTARECKDVIFLSMQVPDGDEGESLKQDLGVQLIPAIQFYREGELLWQQQGHAGMEQEMGEGVLYYGGAAAGGSKATEFVQEINSQQDLEQFINSGDNTLRVVNVSTTLCKPCIKVYPAVLALAKNFVGHAAFGRLLGDDSDETEGLMMKLNILEVPTFIFYRGGKELGRHVGSSRGDLIGNILAYQAAAGLKPPPPPPKAPAAARPRPVRKPARRW